MQLTLLVEWNKSSYVHSLANMVKADVAKVHDEEANNVLPATQTAFKEHLFFKFVFNF